MYNRYQIIDLHALLMNNFRVRVFSIEPTAAVHRCARKITEFASGINVLSDTGCCAERVLLLNILFVHVCVDRHSRSSTYQQFRAQGSSRTTYCCCCTLSIVLHVETFSCSVGSSAVLCMQNNFQIFLSKTLHIFSNFYCGRRELLICRVHQLGLERIKNGALYGAGFARR